MSVAREAIERLVARLTEFGVPYSVPEGHLSIEPDGPNTFPIRVRDDVVEATIHACTWHTHFDDPDAVVSCVSSLLTPFARIVEQYAGKSFEGAWVEVYDSNGWSGPLEIFWTIRPPKFVSRLLGKSEKHVFYQQDVIPVSPEFKEHLQTAELDERGYPPQTVLGRYEVG